MDQILRGKAKDHGWTLTTAIQRVALFTGVNPRTIQRWFAGEVEPRGRHIPGLCSALGIDPNDLFGWPASHQRVVAMVEAQLQRRRQEDDALLALGNGLSLATDTATKPKPAARSRTRSKT